MAEIKRFKNKNSLFHTSKQFNFSGETFSYDAPHTGPRIASKQTGNICYIRERNIRMLKNELILSNPLKRMGFESDDILKQGEFGAVMARAGVGKTALLVQLALNSMLRVLPPIIRFRTARSYGTPFCPIASL